MTKRPQGESPAHGRIVEVLNDLRPSDLAARFAILRHDLPQEFPPEVLQQANLFPPDVLPEEIEGRVDLRALPLAERKQMGIRWVLFFVIMAGLTYAVKRTVWADVDH